jgi:hypothetical protein
MLPDVRVQDLVEVEVVVLGLLLLKLVHKVLKVLY